MPPKSPEYFYQNDRNKTAIDALNLIESTLRFVASNTIIQLSNTDEFKTYQARQKLMEISREQVNILLGSIGGISFDFEDPLTGQVTSRTLYRWHGTDPEHTDQLLWQITPLHPWPTISTFPEVIPEIRAKFESNF